MLDLPNHVAEFYKKHSLGRFRLRWTVFNVLLRFPHPGTSATNNIANWCNAGAGQGYEDVTNDSLDQFGIGGCIRGGCVVSILPGVWSFSALGDFWSVETSLFMSQADSWQGAFNARTSAENRAGEADKSFPL
jgi:hypothetical protein